jgi:hypothetical protein
MKNTHRWITTASAAAALAIVTAAPVVHAQATDPAARAPVTDTTRADDDGNWGWIGLIGLIGLAGLMRGNREHSAAMRTSTTPAR